MIENGHAIIVGMIDAYRKEVQPTDTVICINRAYLFQKQFSKVSAVFMLDDPDLFAGDVVKEINELGSVVYTRNGDNRFRGVLSYPLKQVVDYFNGLEYFTCTAAYAIAMCIMDGYRKITLHGMYHVQDSLEYIHHKPCIDFWCGMALGRGIDLQYDDDRMTVCKPMPWQPKLYAYKRNLNEYLCVQTLAAAYRATMAYPMRMVDAEEVTPEDNENQRNAINAMLGSV